MTSLSSGKSTSFHSLIGKVTGQPSLYKRKFNYDFGRTLGAGTFGVVKYAKVISTGEEVAVKIILKKGLKGNENMLYEELKMLQQLDHPHIVKFKDWFESKDKFYIVTQLATGGELFDRICDYGKFTEEDARDTVREILEAIDYLHQRDIVHRDLKPENLLYLTPDMKSALVLADFGIAKALQSPDQLLHSMAGSFGYAAPEVLKGTGHGKPCDIWSLGVITYTILSGYSPFRAETVDDFLAEVEDNKGIIFHTKYWKDISQDAKIVIRAMLDVDPFKRPTTRQLLDHPWIAGDNCNTTTDLLPNIREGFNARQRFKRAIEAIKLANRIKSLGIESDSSSDDETDSSAATKVETDDSSKDATLKGNTSPNLLKVAESFSSQGSNSSTGSKPGLGAKTFQQVVMAASRNKDLLTLDDEKEKGTS